MIARITRFFLKALLFMVPLFFGGVHVWMYTLMELAVFGLLMIVCINQIIAISGQIVVISGSKNQLLNSGSTVSLRNMTAWPGSMSPLSLWMGAFLVLTIIQLIPLPRICLEWFSLHSLQIKETALQIIQNNEAQLVYSCFSLFPHVTKLFVFKFTAYCGFFLLVSFYFKSRKDVSGLIKFLIFIGVIFSIYGLVEVFSGHKHILWWPNEFRHGVDLRVFGTFINPDHFAFYLELIVTMALGYLFRKRFFRKSEPDADRPWLKQVAQLFLDENAGIQKNMLLIFLIGIMILALFFSASRGAILSLGFVLIFMTLLMYLKSSQKSFIWSIPLILFIVGLYAFVLGFGPVLDRFHGMDLQSLSSNNRMIYYRSVWPLIKEFCWTGTGMGTFSDVYPMVKPVQLDYAFISHLHNDWLEVLVEGGVFGFSILFAGYFYVLQKFLRLWWKRRDPYAVGVGLGAIGTMLTAGLHSLVDFGLQVPGNAITLLAIMAVGWNSLQNKYAQ